VSSQVLSQQKLESISDQQDEQVIGLPLKRKEDLRLMSGRSRFVDDLKLPGMLYGAVLRSNYAHARIKSLDTREASMGAGVRLVLAAKDLPNYLDSLPVPEMKDGTKLNRPILAADEVSYVGEPVVFIVADSSSHAEDALELVKIDYEALPVVIDPEVAILDDSAKSHSSLKSNLAMVDVRTVGDVDAAFAKAAKIVKVDLVNQRLAPTPLEPRGCVASFDAGTQMLSLWISHQGPFRSRQEVGAILHVPDNRMRVFALDVGGGFGAKISCYQEEVLACFVSMKLGLPVKWIESRSENFLSMTHGRGQIQHAEIATNEKGRILGLKIRLVGDAGAYFTEGSGDATFTLLMGMGQYIVPAYRGEAYIALTNKVPHDAYRGAARPEATYVLERTMDELARELGLDPAEVRLRNFIPKENFPIKMIGGLVYDTGDYSMNLTKALVLSNYDKWREEQRRARASGRLFGVGLTTYVEICAFGPDFPQTAAVTVSPRGKVTVITGNSPHGQGHETPLAQIAAEKFGISPDDIFVSYGDTGQLPWGTQTAGSRSAALGGTAVLMCVEKIKAKMQQVAAHNLEVPAEELKFRRGQIISPSGDKRISFEKLAALSYNPLKLPEGMEPVLYAFSCFAPRNHTYPFGTHVAVVEIEKDTGEVRILDYTSVDDCGKVINPMLVEGQIHGGIAQGLGQALLEDLKYDRDGQLLSSSFLDYQIPQASDIPVIHSFRTETPSTSNPLGIKGIGEAGAIASTPAIANAVRDALSKKGKESRVMPFTPDYVWKLSQ